MPVMPMSYWPSETAGIIASQLEFSMTEREVQPLRDLGHGVVFPADRLAGRRVDELQRRIGVLGDDHHLAAAEVGQLGQRRAGEQGERRRRGTSEAHRSDLAGSGSRRQNAAGAPAAGKAAAASARPSSVPAVLVERAVAARRRRGGRKSLGRGRCVLAGARRAPGGCA